MKLPGYICLGLITSLAFAQEQPAKGSLATLSSEIRALTRRAARSVVEIQVTSYGAAAEEGGVGVVSRQQGLLTSPDKHLIPRLGVFGVGIDDEVAKLLPPLRQRAGVLVLARAAEGLGQQIDLQAGDIIHALNGRTIASIQYLLKLVSGLKPGAAVALQIEREGQMDFVSFLIE